MEAGSLSGLAAPGRLEAEVEKIVVANAGPRAVVSAIAQACLNMRLISERCFVGKALTVHIDSVPDQTCAFADTRLVVGRGGIVDATGRAPPKDH